MDVGDPERPGLNLRVSDGHRVFAKVSRPGSVSGVLAEGVIAQALAGRGADVLEPLTAGAVSCSGCGAARQVTVWPHLDLQPDGRRGAVSAVEEARACVNGIAAFAMMDVAWWRSFITNLPAGAPHTSWLRNIMTSTGEFDPHTFMDRIELRLAAAAGRDRTQVRPIGGRGFTRADAGRAAAAADVARAVALAHHQLEGLDGLRSTHPVVLHGDPHPGNLVWRTDGPRLIDLEMMAAGPVEHDLGQVLHGIVFIGAGAPSPADAPGTLEAFALMESLVRHRTGLEHVGLQQRSWERVVWWARMKAASGASFLLSSGADPAAADRMWRRSWQATAPFI